MAKKRLSNVSKVTAATDSDYIVMNTADGKTVQIRKVELAKALAANIPVAITSTDLNSDISIFSIKAFNASTINTPTEYGICVNFPVGQYVLQISASISTDKRFFFRTGSISTGTMGAWIAVNGI